MRAMAAVAKMVVRASRLRVIVVVVMPHGVRLRISTVMEVRARLIPMLRAVRSMLSISFSGNRTLIKL